MDNCEARRARRHIRRAQDLLGFGGTGLNFGGPNTNQDDEKKIPLADFRDDLKYTLFSHLDVESLGKLRETAKKVRVDEYLTTIAKDPEKIKEIARRKDYQLLRMVMIKLGSEGTTKVLMDEIKKNDDGMARLLLIPQVIPQAIPQFFAIPG